MRDKDSGEASDTKRPDGQAASAVARLCYVDDSRTAAYVVRRLLEPCGYQVDYFRSAEPAIVALVQEDYDLLLTDLKVSSQGMDGDDLIRTLRQSGHAKISKLPIIVITGSTDAEVLVKVYDAGANLVMTKPVDGKVLDGHIRRLLAERRGEGPPRQATPGDEIEVPLVTPLNTGRLVLSEEPVVDERVEEKTIPVLQAVESVAAPPAATPELLSPAAALPAEEDVVVEEVIVEPDSPRHPRRDKGAEAAANADEFEAFEGEVEVIIDPERPAGRKRHSRSHGGADILAELNQHSLGERGYRPTASGQRWRRFGRRLLWLLLLVLLAVGGVEGWRYYFDKGLPVQTALVEAGEIYQSIVVPGHVVSQQQVEISSAREGRLVAVLAEEGDKVTAGQVLARLDNRELLTRLKRVEVDLANAREDVSLADRTLERLRVAFDKGAVARRFVEDAEVKLRSARARAGVAVEALHNATLELENLKVSAPFSGIITIQNAEIGQWVTPADTLFVLADETRRDIEVRVDTADSTNVTAGQLVLVTSEAFPDQEWQESVVRVGAAADSERDANSVRVYISLGAEAPVLRFGQQVDAEIRTAWNPNAIKVPFEALQNDAGQVSVAVLEKGRVQIKPVITGIEDFTMAEIRQGLSEGEEIILPKGRTLRDGDKAYPAYASN